MLLSKKNKKRFGLAMFVGVFLFQLVGAYGAESEAKEIHQGKESMEREGSYANYIKDIDTTKKTNSEIKVPLFEVKAKSSYEILKDFEGEKEVLLAKEDGFVEWDITVPEEGFYNIYIEYFPIKGRGIDIERKVLINGEVPFLGADTITLSRIWTDKNEIKKDNRGNDIRPSQVEVPRWETSYFKDYMGYYTEPYQFYFKKGKNSLRLEGISEPLAIRELVLKNEADRVSYEEYAAAKENEKFANQQTQKDFQYKVQGEDSNYRSDPTLYSIFDRSSSSTEPYSASKITLNMIGGNAWRVPGQWIEWEVEVPEDGLYSFSIKGRQNYNRGYVSNRKLLIDGEVPFEEVAVIPFKYSNEWQLNTLSNENGEAYLFRLEKGNHTIRLENTLGELGEMLNKAEESIYALNNAYRKILVLTGATPDAYRDYQVEKVYPEVIELMAEESQKLFELVDELTAYSGQKGTQAASVQTLATQLQRFVEKPHEIPKSLANFKTNIGALGTSVLNMREAPLDIDYLLVSAAEATLPVVKEGFLEKAVHEVRSFVASFFEDYNSIGNVYEEDAKPIDVWILSGRDQSTILKAMIDDTFTPNTGISVNVRLITANVLLPAVVAGTGPDVALNVAFTEPVNFALRGASEDLSGYAGFEEMSKQFYPSAFESYKFNDGIYAMPETQNFPVIFYRKDILEELGLEIPNTWKDLIHMLPTIQKNNMEVGISSADTSAFLAQLYQRGGSLYEDGGKKILIDSTEGVESFEFFTMLFTHYKLPLIYDFPNRFRTGEMPIGIADYSTFNMLSVFAPEIRGLWGFAPLPGIEDKNGDVDRSCSSWGTCSMMLSSAKDKDKAWEFLKWWNDSETQIRFGREMESLMGASARYATANTTAFEELSWSNENSKMLKEQWQFVKGTPEVPGGYFATRHILNAFRKVVYNNDEARETLLDYTRTINDELVKKRKEFGLPID